MQSTRASVSLIHYNSTECVVQRDVQIRNCADLDRKDHVVWLNIVGLKDTAVMSDIADVFGIHPLVMEDIVHTHQRAKVEDYGDYLFIVLRQFALRNKEIAHQQVSFILKDNVLITLREQDFNQFDIVADKIVAGSGNLRRKGEDYLLYHLLDTIIDHYYFTLEHISETIEVLEDDIIHDANKQSLVRLQHMKREIIFLRKSVAPVREMLLSLSRNEVEYFDKENELYLRDLVDHAMRALDSIETYRDILTSLMDLYYSQVSNKMNEVMKTLTVISSIFIPLTFIVGIYGMNFDNMPELHWPLGYFFVLGGMIFVAVSMLFYFWRKRWF